MKGIEMEMQRNEGNEVENVTRFVGKSGVVPRSRVEAD